MTVSSLIIAKGSFHSFSDMGNHCTINSILRENRTTKQVIMQEELRFFTNSAGLCRNSPCKMTDGTARVIMGRHPTGGST